MSTRDYIDKLNRYFWFTKEELVHFIIVVLGLTIIYAWPKDNLLYPEKLPVALIFIAITVFIHHAGQRLMALALGFRAEQKMWWYGLLIGLILVILSAGKIKFLAATATLAFLMPAHRIGAFRYGPNLTTLSKISLAGPLLNIFFSAAVKSLEWAGLLSPAIGQELFTLNIAFAAWNLLPIPPLDGAKVIYFSRVAYVFMFASIVSYVLMVYFLSFYSYITALAIGVIAWLFYWYKYES